MVVIKLKHPSSLCVTGTKRKKSAKLPAAPNIANGNTNRIRIKNHQAAQGKAAAEEEAGIEAQAEEEEEGEAKRAEQLRENVGKVEKPFIPQCLQSPLPIELFPPTASGQNAEGGGGQGGGKRERGQSKCCQIVAWHNT